MSDPQPLLFRVVMYECDRCQFRQKLLMDYTLEHLTLPAVWRKENGYTLCGNCDFNAMEPEYREAMEPPC